MFKRLLSLIAAALLLASATAALAQQEQVKLQVSYWGNTAELEVKTALFQKFEETHPNIKLELTYTTGAEYPTKLQTLISANMAPDVMAIASDVMYPFKGIGIFEDLNAYIAKDNLQDKYEQIGLKTFTYTDGTLQAAPYVSKVFAIAYNKALFDAAGLAYPTNDWTENQMLELARNLTKGEGMDKQFGFFWNWAPNEMMRNLYGVQPVYDVQTMTMQAVENPSFKTAVSLLHKMISEEEISPDATAQKSVGGGFETGKYAMAMVLTSHIANLTNLIGDTFGWDIVMLPVNETYGRWNSTLRLDGYTMSSKSTHKQEAWELIKFLTANEEIIKASGKFGLPMLKSVLKDEAAMTNLSINSNININNFVKMVDYAVPFDGAGVWAEVNTTITDKISTYLLNEIDLDTMIGQIQEEGAALLP